MWLFLDCTVDRKPSEYAMAQQHAAPSVGSLRGCSKPEAGADRKSGDRGLRYATQLKATAYGDVQAQVECGEPGGLIA